MPDTQFSAVLPPLKAIDNGDGTYSVAVSGTLIQGVIDAIEGLQTTTETLQDIINAMAANSDGLQSVQIEHWLDRSLNNVYLGRIWNLALATMEKPDIDIYWTAAGLTCPVGYRWLSIVSRARFMFPAITVETILTNLALVGASADIHFGVEAGANHKILDVKFLEHDGKAYFALVPPHTEYNVEITALLPVDYDTAKHRYTIKVNRAIAELYIDNELKAIGLLGLPEPIATVSNVLPYALISIPTGIHGSFALKYEVSDDGTQALTSPTPMSPTIISAPNRIAIFDGDPCPPRQYQLYTENTATKWSTLAALNGVTYNSHPVPIWGYENKTLAYVLTATLSTAKIQVYVGGGWEDLANLTVDGAIHFYDITAEAPIVRLVVTGGAGDGVVNKAQVYMR